MKVTGLKKKEIKTTIFMVVAIGFLVSMLGCGNGSVKTSPPEDKPTYPDGVIYNKTMGDQNGSVGQMNFQYDKYKVVRIANRWWMAENLHSMLYNNGYLIPLVENATGWAITNQGARCYYDNSLLKEIYYGQLYNWFAVKTGKLAPPGWAVPDKETWEKMIKSYGEPPEAGKYLKEKGSLYWDNFNSGTNSSGLSVRGSGYRRSNGNFEKLKSFASFFHQPRKITASVWKNSSHTYRCDPM